MAARISLNSNRNRGQLIRFRIRHLPPKKYSHAHQRNTQYSSSSIESLASNDDNIDIAVAQTIGNEAGRMEFQSSCLKLLGEWDVEHKQGCGRMHAIAKKVYVRRLWSQYRKSQKQPPRPYSVRHVKQKPARKI